MSLATNRQNGEPVISLDNVTIEFDNTKLFGRRGSTVHAVDKVSLDVFENEVVALVGESGCGKTTLGKTAIGLHRPTSGTVKFRGQDIWEAKDLARKPWRYKARQELDIPFRTIRRSLQMVHQDPESALNANYTVESLLSDPLARWEPQLQVADRRARIYGLLEYVGMSPAEDYAGRYPHQLSGGEQQRVALIRALLLNPDMILADEAVSALDVSLRVETMDLLLELQRQFNTSYLFISHNLSNARYLAEKSGGRIAVMYLGKIVEIGEPHQIIHNPKHPYTEVLRWATGDIHADGQATEPPIRTLDIPDSSNPPPGCAFHTRCPYARPSCRNEIPETIVVENNHTVKCFREEPDHNYWDEEPLYDQDMAAVLQLGSEKK